MQVRIMTKYNFTNTYHVNANTQALALTESNIFQFSIFTEFSNSNFIKIEIISTEKITLYDKSQATKQLQKVVLKFLKI